jgi:hypothetical protein
MYLAERLTVPTVYFQVAPLETLTTIMKNVNVIRFGGGHICNWQPSVWEEAEYS